MFEEVYYVNDL